MRKRGARGSGSGPWHGGACRPAVECLDIRAFLLAQWIERTMALRRLVACSALDPCQETLPRRRYKMLGQSWRHRRCRPKEIIAMHSRRYKTYAIDGVAPVIDPTAFVHPDAVLIGDVIVGAGCYVGPCASLRGDFGRIVLEDGCNVQDNCTLHSMPGFDLVIGRDGHIGHGAIIHSAHIGTNAMVGMNAVVMDHATVGESSIVAAMSFVKAGAKISAKTPGRRCAGANCTGIDG